MCAEGPDPACNRISFLSNSVSTAGSTLGLGILACTLAPEGAAAKTKNPSAEEVPVDWKEEFSKVRAGSADLIEDLRKLASDEDWPALMETTKFSDLAFRKSVMGKVRKKFPKEDKQLKDEGQSLSNAVTFDLIAVNKAARVADKARALEVCDILQGDVNTFLELERRIR